MRSDMRSLIELTLVLSLLLGACPVVPQVSQLFATPTPAAFTVTLTPKRAGTPTVTLRPLRSLTPTREPTDTPTPTPASSPEFFKLGLSARRNGDYTRASAAFQGALSLKPPSDLARESQFRLAESYYLSNDSERAIASLSSYLQAYPQSTEAYATRYFLADLYRARKDYWNALAQLRIMRDQTQTLAGEIDAEIAQVLELAGDSANANAQYDRALADSTLSPSARVRISLRAGATLIASGNRGRAAARYDAALAFANDAPTRAALNLFAGQAYAAANQMDSAIARWNRVINETPEQPSAYTALLELVNRNIPVDEYQRGLVDYQAGAYDAAIAAFQRHLQGPSPRAGAARYYLASALARKGSYPQAITEYDIIIDDLRASDRVPEAILGKAEALQALGKIDDAISTYKQLPALVPNDAQADQALLRAGETLERVKRYRDAAPIFDQLFANYSTRDSAAEALFRAGLDYYRTQDNQNATARWQTLVQRYPQSAFFSSAFYWLGKAAAARGQIESAQSFWTQAAALSQVGKPFRYNYYSARAKSALGIPQRPDERRLFDLTRYSMGSAADRAELENWLGNWTRVPRAFIGQLDEKVRGDLHFRRGEELLRLNRIVDARLEFAVLIDETWKDDVPALYALAVYFQDAGLYSLSVTAADRIAVLASSAGAPNPPRYLNLLRYPTYYSDLVVAESRANRINPLLYFATLRLESRFDPLVTGPLKEKGLGQLTSAVARSVAQYLNMKDFKEDQLYLPFVNLRMGTWLFAQDAKQFEDPIYAFAAYNAGLGRALGWRNANVDLAVEEMDIASTMTYVHITYAYWRQYEELYR